MVHAIIDIPLQGQPLANLSDQDIPGQAAGALRHFLTGPENHLVKVVVRAVLEEDAGRFNPIVLYGASGTGKSHLALGLAAAWRAKYHRRVECVAAVDFARELADAIETQAVEEFRAKYREAGLLVFEDIGRMVNRKSEKLSAQDEFIHTLDALMERGSRVIITSASAPGEMTGVLPTLQSRLTAGLIVPLTPPGVDARLEIVRRFAELRQVDIPQAVAQSLAEGLPGTAPELMGAVLQLELPARGRHGRVDADAVRQWLKDRGNGNEPNIHSIALATAKHFGLKLSELRSPSRHRAVVSARNAAVYLSRKLVRCSFEQIGRYFGGRDHATVMHGCEKMTTSVKNDPATRCEVENLEKEILGLKK
jgi:chromosomal replication initiator protein